MHKLVRNWIRTSKICQRMCSHLHRRRHPCNHRRLQLNIAFGFDRLHLWACARWSRSVGYICLCRPIQQDDTFGTRSCYDHRGRDRGALCWRRISSLWMVEDLCRTVFFDSHQHLGRHCSSFLLRSCKCRQWLIRKRTGKPNVQIEFLKMFFETMLLNLQFRAHSCNLRVHTQRFCARVSRVDANLWIRHDTLRVPTLLAVGRPTSPRGSTLGGMKVITIDWVQLTIFWARM